MLHELSDRVLAIADTFLKLRCDESNGFGLVEAESTGEAFLSKKSCLHES